MSTYNGSPPVRSTPIVQNAQDQTPYTSEMIGQSRDVLYGQDPAHSSQTNSQNLSFHSFHSSTSNLQNMPGQNGGQSFNVHPVNLHSTQQNTVQPDMRVNSGQDNGSGMPSWAANISRQLQTIQNQLDMQNQRWQSVENQLQSQNMRMTNIETQISQLSNLNKTVSETTRNVQNITTEVKSLKSKLNDYEESVQYYSGICDSLIDTNTEFKDRLASIEQAQATKDEKLIDLQWRGMRENLIFSGIPESELGPNEYEDCENLIKSFIREQMHVARDIQFDRVHRLGRFKRTQRYPRPIVAKFTYYKDKEEVRKAAPKSLIGTNFSVNEQFPQEIEERRKVLYPIAKDARRNQNTVRLVRDKLFINGQQYNPRDQTTAKQPYMPKTAQEKQNRQFIPNNGQNNTRQFDRNTRSFPDRPFLIGRKFSQPKHKVQSEMTRPVSSAIGKTDNTHSRNIDAQPCEGVYTSNTYMVLNGLGNDGGNITPHCFGKKKATSPLDSDLTLKKQKDYTSDNNSVMSQGETSDYDCECIPDVQNIDCDK